MREALRQLRGRRILVTGAAGFLGSHQIAALRGFADLHAVSRRALPADEGTTAHTADLANRESVFALFHSVRPEIVLHLAGYANGGQAIESLYPSVTGDLLTTVHILEAAHVAGCRRVVITGSLEEADAESIPASPYAVSKRAASQYAELCHRLYDLPVVTARIFMTYGPGQRRTKLIPQMIETLAQGRPFEVHSADRLVDWIYVDDVTQALLLCAATPDIEGRTVDIGSGALMPVGNLARLAARAMDREDLLRFAPPDRRDERIRKADIEQTKRLLAWQPTVSLNVGLQKTIEAFAPKEAVL